MLPKDNFYSLILERRLPLRCKDKNVKQFLEDYYANYMESYKKALTRTKNCALREECYELIYENTNITEELCNDILKVFNYYNSADMLRLYRHFEDMMREIASFLEVRDISDIGYERFKNYYRMRDGKKDFSRLDLFHIPLDKRELIKSYRYSISGYPCIYLSSGIEMCWFECGMPKEFSNAEFFFESYNQKKVDLIDFTIESIKLVKLASINANLKLSH